MNNDNHRTQQTAVWDRQHGYENRMADDNWSQNNHFNNSAANSWSTVDPNSAWGEESQQHNQQHSSRQQPPQPPTRPEVKKDGFGIFVQESNFPSWDD